MVRDLAVDERGLLAVFWRDCDGDGVGVGAGNGNGTFFGHAV